MGFQKTKKRTKATMEEEYEETNLATPGAVEKYKKAAEIAKAALSTVIEACVPGANIVDLCALGDNTVDELAGKCYGKIEDKGLSFPTCINVNNCIANYSPLAANSVALEVADVICAAYFASDAAVKLVRPGRTSNEVTEVISKIADIFHCTPVEDVLSGQLSRFILDSDENVIENKHNIEDQIKPFEFEVNQAYQITVVMSSGTGSSRNVDGNTTVHCRVVEEKYNLKMKASRYLFSQVNKKYPCFPFSIRALDDKRAKLGLKECVKHNLLAPYPILHERDGTFVAQFKFTVLVLPNGIQKLGGYDQLPYVRSDYSINDPEI